MTDCLAATGFDTWPLLLALGLAVTGAGAAALLLRRGHRRTATLAAAPLLILALLASGLGAPTASFAAPGCPTATATPTPTPTPDPTTYSPGAAGIGDPYFPLDGNGGYDVHRYLLDLTYDPATNELSGTTTIEATATQNLSAFNLDFDTRRTDGTDSILIDAITVEGAQADWSLATTQISMITAQPQLPASTDEDATPPRTELTVIPTAGIPLGATFSTTVTYAGVPITIDDAFGPAGVFEAPDGAVTVGQPRVAATWFPANDHPSDKAAFDLRMTAPDGVQVIGNGRLAGSTPAAEGTTEWHWIMDQPMATYLATATIGHYAITTTTDPATGITYYDAIDPGLYEREAEGGGATVGEVAAATFATEPEVIAFLSEHFGPYPFTEAGGIAIGEIAPGEDLPYALENQTRPIYPAWSFPADADASVVVHELAHQWYGDSVAMHRWSDIWLNEGFATYAEWLWAESQGGPTPQQQFDAIYAGTPADDPFWSTLIADPGPAAIFDDAVYTRGALTLQALRTELGTPAFATLLKGWATDNQGGTVTTAQFITYAEQLAGRDLTTFFDAWLSTPEKPTL